MLLRLFENYRAIQHLNKIQSGQEVQFFFLICPLITID